jgi:hypothetical protein
MCLELLIWRECFSENFWKFTAPPKTCAPKISAGVIGVPSGGNADCGVSHQCKLIIQHAYIPIIQERMLKDTKILLLITWLIEWKCISLVTFQIEINESEYMESLL